MEDYTYHLAPARPQVLGAHMLEVCPSIAAGDTRRARSIRWASAARPTRCGWSSRRAPGRRSPSACSTWATASAWSSTRSTSCARPRTCRGCRWRAPSGSPGPAWRSPPAAWMLAGGPHHTSFSTALSREHLEDFAEMAGIELVVDRRRHDGRRHREGAALEPRLLPAGAGSRRRAGARRRPATTGSGQTAKGQQRATTEREGGSRPEESPQTETDGATRHPARTRRSRGFQEDSDDSFHGAPVGPAVSVGGRGSAGLERLQFTTTPRRPGRRAVRRPAPSSARA